MINIILTRRAHRLRRAGRVLATTILLIMAAASAGLVWQYYVDAPWTRDGRVRVLVANVAPQVSGQITHLLVSDNQGVHKNQVLYDIDPFDFRVRLGTPRAVLRMREADLKVKGAEAQRRLSLTNLSTSVEETQRNTGDASIAEAQQAQAEYNVGQSQIDLARTEVRSPVDGYVTNLQLRVGDYATAGASNVSVVDRNSFWVDGCFAETTLARICVGAEARVELMGFGKPIIGRIGSIGRGISVSDATSGTQGLPGVDPVYTWVRLAQRLPVRIAITSIPSGIPLASGLTATIRIREPRDADRGHWSRLRDAADGLLSSIGLSATGSRSCALTDGPATAGIDAVGAAALRPSSRLADAARGSTGR